MPSSSYPATAGQTTSIVNTGTGAWDTIYADLLEHVPDLIWPASNWVYARMRRDPQLAGILAAYTLPIRRASAHVNPLGCREEVVKAVADDLGLPILGVEDSAPRGPHRFRWEEFLRLSMLHLPFGHMGFAKAFDVLGPRTKLATVVERLPVSIAEILVNDGTGELVGIRQYARLMEGTDRFIRREELVWFAHDREGMAWQGQSLLRPAYAPWLLKHEVQRVHATSIRRFGMGVPGVEAPAGATPAQVAEATAAASAMRVGDQSGIGVPNGFRPFLMGLTGSVPDALAFLRYLDQQMSRMALTGVLDLGDTPNGSRALGDTMLDLLMLSQQSLADYTAEVITADLAADIVALNWGPDEPVPCVEFGDVGAQHQVTAEALRLLLVAGAISPDPELERFVRGEYKIPQRDPNAPPAPQVVPSKTQLVQEAPALDTAPDPKTVTAGRRVNAAASSLRRDLTTVEAAAKTDFTAVQASWQSALDKLVGDWAAISKDQRKQLVAQIKAAVHDSDTAALGALAVDSQSAAELLAEHLHDTADAAASEMIAEAARQGVDVPAGKVKPDRSRLDQVATAVAALVATGLAAAAARKALQVWQPGAAAKQVADDVGTWLEGLGDTSLRDSLGGGLSVAQNAGRMAVLDAAPKATYAASEINDRNECDACAEVDGTEFDTLADAEAAYASGGYSGCEGGLRCRGVIVAVWDDAAKAT
jgi:hypothetical protein